jgi:hypothetical protein
MYNTRMGSKTIAPGAESVIKVGYNAAAEGAFFENSGSNFQW